MSDTFQCPQCNGEVESNPQLAGQAVYCPHCQGLLTMPGNPFDFVKDRVRSASSVADRFKKNRKMNPMLLVGGGVAAFLFFSMCMCCGIGALFDGGDEDGAESSSPDQTAQVSNGDGDSSPYEKLSMADGPIPLGRLVEQMNEVKIVTEEGGFDPTGTP